MEQAQKRPEQPTLVEYGGLALHFGGPPGVESATRHHLQFCTFAKIIQTLARIEISQNIFLFLLHDPECHNDKGHTS